MSDSDSTLPATDDFGSRFLEFDEYSFEHPDDIESDSFSAFLPQIGSTAEQKVPLLDEESLATTNRHKKYINVVSGDDQDDVKTESSSCDDSEVDGMTYKRPKALTARQLSLQSQKIAVSFDAKNIEQTTAHPKLICLECVNPPKPTPSLTAEQIAVRQKRIANRKESAKHKAEMEKRQTVERLLKINANVIGRRGRGRSKGIRSNGSTTDQIPLQNSSQSEGASNYEVNIIKNEYPNNTLTSFQSSECDYVNTQLVNSGHNDMKLFDNKLLSVGSSNSNSNPQFCSPKPGYIRYISSSRLPTQTVTCLPLGDNISDKNIYLRSNVYIQKITAPEIPKLRLCEMGCGCARRYQCAKTGRSLCSLSCYKTNLTKISGISQTIST
ncbi:Zinc finger HIT type [Schistosoma japonicum]|uniref:Zinc finger HIT type n=1 Tax=Schistosoma japonicum TaxID=6182 RepID=A0A4Z2CXX6_SCHJA|nr:Zinc finger HIT type [Schistosoma japonicum]KAH8868109.1 Zinc finger HIT type [Schistosoma japonicum]TNN09095.1 Zinc finger HIT type [Schistosoma japonicum]